MAKRFVPETEKFIYGFIFKYGFQENDEFYLKIPHEENIIIDGRQYAEEYEDLTSEAPCCVDCLRIYLKNESIAFHMHTAFTTHFPLMSNDWYNFYGFKENIKEKIVSYFKRIESKLEPNKNYIKNVTRKKWLDISLKLIKKDIYPALEYKGGLFTPKVETGVIKYNSFNHAFDCCFCCDNENAPEDRIEFILKEWEKVFERNDIQIAFIISFPTLEHLKDELYLSYQTLNRSVLQKLFINRIIKPLYEKYNINFRNWLITQEPDSVIVNKDTLELRKIDKSEWYKLDKIPNKFEKLSNNYIAEKCNLQYDAPYILEDYYDLSKTKPDNLKQRKVIFKKIEPYNLEYTKKCIFNITSDNVYSFKQYLDKLMSDSKLKCKITFEDYVTKEIFEEIFVYDSVYCLAENYIFPIKNYNYLDNTKEITEIFDDFINKERDTNYNTFFKYIMLTSKSLPIGKIKMIDVDGIKISKSNYLNCAHKYGWNLLVPLGYRLPTRAEIKNILEKHPFNTKKIFDTYKAKNDIGMELNGDEHSIYIGWNTELPYIAVSDYWIDEKEKYTSNVIRAVDIYGNDTYVNSGDERFLIYLIKNDRKEQQKFNKEIAFVDNFINIDKINYILGFKLEDIITINYSVGSKKYKVSINNKYQNLIDDINKIFNLDIKNPKNINIKIDDFEYNEINDLLSIEDLINIIWLYLYPRKIDNLYESKSISEKSDFYKFHEKITHREIYQSLRTLTITSLNFELKDGSKIDLDKNKFGNEYYYYLQKYIFNID